MSWFFSNEIGLISIGLLLGGSFAFANGNGDGAGNCVSDNSTHAKIYGLQTYAARINEKLLAPSDDVKYCGDARDWKAFQAILANTEDTEKTDYGYVYKDKDSLETVLAAIRNGDSQDYISKYEKAKQPDFYKVEGSVGPKNRMAFQSYGKIFGVNTGLCWWHSRFNRSATYLSIFRPLQVHEKEMTEAEASQVIDDIINNRRVVTIRGFNSIFDFSARFQDLIIKKLSHWAERETAGFGWVKGLKESASQPKELKATMDALYEEVEGKGQIAYQMLKPAEVGAHSWLVIGMDPINDSQNNRIGYRLHTIDPGFQTHTRNIDYHFGDRNVDSQIVGFGNVRPYTQNDGDFLRIATAMLAKCNPAKFEKRLASAERDYLTTHPSGAHKTEDQSSDREIIKIIENFRSSGAYPNYLPIVDEQDLEPENWTKLLAR